MHFFVSHLYIFLLLLSIFSDYVKCLYSGKILESAGSRGHGTIMEICGNLLQKANISLLYASVARC